ncbi:MAG: lipoprotein signal peptidase, partial [Ferruginibacter sp.]
NAVFGNWFYLHFVENPGMAYGLKFGGSWGKIALTLFRLGAVIFGIYYLNKIVREKYHTGFIVCASLIFAGALGNLIDSCIYGLIFDKGYTFDAAIGFYMPYAGRAQFSSNGYGQLFQGNVVDMLHFPLINGQFPDWFPIWGGEDFEFFRPIFNIADAAISTGVIALIVFQKKFMPASSASTKDTATTP